MTLHIMTRAEWKRCPTWHESYVDYVQHMRGVQEYLALVLSSQVHHTKGESK